MSYEPDSRTISAGDRLGLTLFFAAVLHAAIVLGVSFDLNARLPASQTVEITLAQQDEGDAPEEADFLAQSNQTGSGTKEDKREITTPVPDEKGVAVAETLPQPVAAPPPQPPQPQQPVVASSKSQKVVPSFMQDESNSPEAPAEPADSAQFLRQSLEIASLEARYMEQRQAYAKRPRVTRLSAVSARKSSSAFYMESWRRELERIGNINYPEEARRRQLNGRVRVMVSMEPDGGVASIEIMESSGHKILDDAVIRIIRLAEPFAPFSDQMLKEMDRLEIIRTFDFGSHLSSF